MAGLFAAVNRRPARARDRPRPDAGVRGGARGPRKADLGPGGALRCRLQPERHADQCAHGSDHLPDIPGFEYTAPGGAAGSGYAVSFDTGSTDGNPLPTARTPHHERALRGLQGPHHAVHDHRDRAFRRRATPKCGCAASCRRSPCRCSSSASSRRSDLTFYAGDNFDFGGRVHTNGNLLLSEAVWQDPDLHRSHHGVWRRRPQAPVERARRRRQRNERHGQDACRRSATSARLGR